MPTSIRSCLQNGRIDRIAIALSGMCVAHCIGTAVLLGVLASAGGIFENPLFHEVGLVLAILLGAVMPAAVGSLGLGIMAGALTLDHGWQESAYTLLGVVTLALGHDLNHRAGR